MTQNSPVQKPYILWPLARRNVSSHSCHGFRAFCRNFPRPPRRPSGYLKLSLRPRGNSTSIGRSFALLHLCLWSRSSLPWRTSISLGSKNLLTKTRRESWRFSYRRYWILGISEECCGFHFFKLTRVRQLYRVPFSFFFESYFITY